VRPVLQAGKDLKTTVIKIRTPSNLKEIQTRRLEHCDLWVTKSTLQMGPSRHTAGNFAMFPILGVMLLSAGFTALRFANRQGSSISGAPSS
jgi:hypothetical protein